MPRKLQGYAPTLEIDKETHDEPESCRDRHNGQSGRPSSAALRERYELVLLDVKPTNRTEGQVVPGVQIADLVAQSGPLPPPLSGRRRRHAFWLCRQLQPGGNEADRVFGTNLPTCKWPIISTRPPWKGVRRVVVASSNLIR